jgi:hypothetical protein
LTEAGPAPWLADFGLLECLEGETEVERYRARCRRCLRDCDAVLIFGELASPGSRVLIRDGRGLGKRWVAIKPGLTSPRHITEFIRVAGVSRLMLAGDRESRHPGIAARVERYLLVVFRSLATTRHQTT